MYSNKEDLHPTCLDIIIAPIGWEIVIHTKSRVLCIVLTIEQKRSGHDGLQDIVIMIGNK